MAEEEQEFYHIDFMRTLWENTYRGTVFDSMDHYIATIRMVLSIPLDREGLPENAPEVAPLIIVLVEDTVLTPQDVLDFETVMSKLIIKKASSEYFHPDRCMFFYPSPAEVLENEARMKAAETPLN